MKVLVVGPGSVGGYLAARLASSGTEVAVLARGPHGEAIRAKGLTLEGKESLTVPLAVSDTAEDFAPLEYVFLTTKFVDLAPALRSLIPFVKPATTFVTFQNGLDATEFCRAVFPSNPIITGIAYIDTQIVEPGMISVGTSASFAFGSELPRDRNHPSLLAEILKQAGIPADLPRNFPARKWSKLAWNAVFNPLCAISRLSVGEIRANPAMLELARDLLSEIQAVARTEKVTIDPVVIDDIFGRSQPQTFNADTRTSMWSDLAAGKKTEIDYLNGAVVARGTKHGIPTPANQVLIQLVHALERSRTLSKT